MSRTIVLIHGNFVTNRCWDGWAERFRARGHDVITPPYPLRDRPVAELKRHPRDPALGALALPEVIEYHERILRALPLKPIVMGHSFGGLLTQLMMDRDLGAAGVAVDSVPPQGVLPLEWSFFRGTWPVVNPLIPASRPWYMSFEQFRYAFGNDLSEADARAAYDAHIVPESRRLSRGGLSRAARVDFQRRRGPLLLVGGGRDHIVPAALNRRTWRRYRKGPSITEYHEFADRAHYSVIAGPGSEVVADFALDWALRAIGEAPALTLTDGRFPTAAGRGATAAQGRPTPFLGDGPTRPETRA